MVLLRIMIVIEQIRANIYSQTLIRYNYLLRYYLPYSHMQFRNNIKTPFSLKPPTKLIIDTHGGLQDILAIVFAHRLIQQLGTGQQIIGITCVAGKNSVQDSVKSALVVNKLLKTNIPIFKGQKQSLMLRTQYPQTYMSQKFAGIEQMLYKDLQQDQNAKKSISSQKAVDFIIRACKQHRENLGVVALGPVTNLGLAHRLENCLNLVSLISLTGGQYMGMGNTVVGHIEANFAHDPLAAHILFQIKHDAEYLKDKIYVNVIEKTLQYSLKLALNTCIDSGKLNSKIGEIFQNMLGINSIVINCAPLLTVVPLVQPNVVKCKHHVYAEIVRDGQNTDGLFAINWLKVGAKKGQYESFAYIYEDYDHSLLNDLFVLAFTSSKGNKP